MNGQVSLANLRSLPQDLTGPRRVGADFRNGCALAEEIRREPIIPPGAELRLGIASAGVQIFEGGSSLVRKTPVEFFSCG